MKLLDVLIKLFAIKMKIFPFNTATLVLCVITFCPIVAMADIYRCDKQAGVITLSNVEKGKSCKKMALPPPDKRAKPAVADGQKPVPAGSAAETKQAKNKATYDSAVSERKRIIQEEIDLEQERLNKTNEKITTLAASKKKSAAQEKELNTLQQKQSLYQSNISLLQKELSK